MQEFFPPFFTKLANLETGNSEKQRQAENIRNRCPVPGELSPGPAFRGRMPGQSFTAVKRSRSLVDHTEISDCGEGN